MFDPPIENTQSKLQQSGNYPHIENTQPKLQESGSDPLLLLDSPHENTQLKPPEYGDDLFLIF